MHLSMLSCWGGRPGIGGHLWIVKIATKSQQNDARKTIKTVKSPHYGTMTTAKPPTYARLTPQRLNIDRCIIQQQPRLAHIFNQPRIISNGKKTITQGRFSSRKTSLNHTSIIKSCKQRSTFKRFVFKPEGNLQMIYG